MKRPGMTLLVGISTALLSATMDIARARTPEVVEDNVILVGILSVTKENAAVKSATLTVGETLYYITLDEMGTKAAAEAPGSTLEVNGNIPHSRARTSVKLTVKNYTIRQEAAAVVVNARTLHDSYFSKQVDVRSKFDGATVQVSGTICEGLGTDTNGALIPPRFCLSNTVRPPLRSGRTTNTFAHTFPRS